MADYYLSTYVDIDPLAYLENLHLRHDQNISLWKLEGDKLSLMHYWELERETREKHHSRSFYNLEHFTLFANQMLAQYGLTLNNMKEIIGSPKISTCSINEYGSYLDYPNIAYHSIAHLFSSILSDTDVFQSEKIIALSLDGSPDKVLDTCENQNYFCGSYSENGIIKDVFAVSSPAVLVASKKAPSWH